MGKHKLRAALGPDFIAGFAAKPLGIPDITAGIDCERECAIGRQSLAAKFDGIAVEARMAGNRGPARAVESR
jgi:hypothetical protein